MREWHIELERFERLTAAFVIVIEAVNGIAIEKRAARRIVVSKITTRIKDRV